MYSTHADLTSRQLLEPVKALGFRIQAAISDADQKIRRAVTTTLPGCSHQLCQVHCPCEAGQPIFEADRAMKTNLKREIRAKWQAFGRCLSQAPGGEPPSAVVMDHDEAPRDVPPADGLSPFGITGLDI